MMENFNLPVQASMGRIMMTFITVTLTMGFYIYLLQYKFCGKPFSQFVIALSINMCGTESLLFPVVLSLNTAVNPSTLQKKRQLYLSECLLWRTNRRVDRSWNSAR